MADPITQHTGSKYLRDIREASGPGVVKADVYAVLKGFAVTCPATAHAVKKCLCAGIRGKGSRVQDLIEARDAISRVIEMERDDEAS